MDTGSGKWSGAWLLVVPLVGAAAGTWLFWGEELPDFLRGLARPDWQGQLGFVALYVAVTLAGMPVGWLVVSAGALFEPLLALGLVTASGLVGASLAFALARRLGRQAAQRWLLARRGWSRLEPLMKAQGGPVVALTRLLPGVPFSLQNYAFGLSSIAYPTYLLWTFLGIVPSGAVTIYGVAALRQSLSGRPDLAMGLVALGLALGLSLAVRLFRWLSQREQADEKTPEG